MFRAAAGGTIWRKAQRVPQRVLAPPSASLPQDSPRRFSVGYTIGFLLLALIGGAGLAIIYVLLPETMPQKFH